MRSVARTRPGSENMDSLQNVLVSKIILRVTTTQAVGSFGFGGGAAEGQEAANNYFRKSVDNFATAHHATQSSIAGLMQQNTQLNSIPPDMQYQLDMLSQQLTQQQAGGGGGLQQQQ